MNRYRGVIIAMVSLLLTGCGGDEIVVDPAPRLLAVKAAASSLVLPSGESANMPFTVKDEGYSFNYSVSTPQSQVRLMLDGGKTPDGFYLSDVYYNESERAYIAVIADDGKGKKYDTDAYIAIIHRNAETGAESFVKSGAIHIMAETTPAGTVKTGLPIVYVNTDGGKAITSKTDWVTGSVSIRGQGSIEGMNPATCRIRGRGNTTWTWPKKPYLVAFDEQQSVFGFPRHKRWVLLANFMDRTLMRNLVSMKVSSLTSLEWTPRCQSVEVVLNGTHIGSYLLIEQVRVDKDRVNVGKDGWLFELDFHYDNPVQWYDHGIPFSVKYPDSDDITESQKAWARNYIAEVAGAIYGSSFKDPVNGYAKYLDVDSFIDYWIVYEVMCNHELGNPGSVFFHKSANGKLTAGPCWDFDWGVLSFQTSNGADNLVNGSAIWYARLFQDPAFKARVKARFLELKPQLLGIPAYMDECEAYLTESARLNFTMWNPAGDATQNNGNIINGDENLSFHDAVVRLKKNYLQHLQVIESKL